MLDSLHNKKVVIFGAGNNGRLLTAKLIKDGIAPAYFVDNYPNVEFIEFDESGKRYAISVNSPNTLFREDKSNLQIIISAGYPYYNEIEAQLTDMGFGSQIISSRVSYCDGILNRLGFYCDTIGFCCESSSDFNSDRPSFPYFETAQETLFNFFKKRKIIKEELDGLREINLSKPCTSCSRLGSNDIFQDNKIRYISISCYPSVCQASCIYCDAQKNPKNTYQDAEAAGYLKMIAEMIHYLRDNEICLDNCKVLVAPPEITITPHKDLLLEAIADYESHFRSNCFLFDQKIADSLRKNGSTLNISLDCGTRETFQVVKRRDMFDKVVSNLKRYRSYGKIEIKYNILPGVNDEEQDFIGIVHILKLLDINELVISFDYETPLRTSFYSISALIRKLNENGLKFKFHAYYSAAQLENSIEEYITPHAQAEYNHKNKYLREIFYKDFKDNYDAYRKFVRDLELKELSNCLESEVKLSEKDIENYFFSFEPAAIYAKRLNCPSC